MKIAVITNYWINSPGGGVREYTKNLVTELKKKVEVIMLYREGMDEENYKLPHSKVKFIFKSLEILKREKPDVILSQGGWFTEIPAYLYKIKNCRTKILVLFHTQYSSRMPLHKRLFYNYLINKFDAIGFVSKALERNVREVAGLKIKRKTFILYAGAMAKEVRANDIEKFKKDFNIPDGYTILLGLGLTALSYKAEGAKILMRSVKILVNKGYPIILILTREGKYSKELKEYAKKIGIEKNVIFTGNVENPYVPLALCDIYTHITLGEGLPISLLEAMAMGKPIIATPVGGIPEAIENGKSGILVDIDEYKIANEIEKLIKDDDLKKKLGKKARKIAERKFSWERTAEKLLKVISTSKSFNKL